MKETNKRLFILMCLCFFVCFFSHNNKTAIYQHPFHARPPPPYQRPPNMDEEEETKGGRGDRKAPARSHSHRSSQSHRVFDSHSSLLRRSKSVRDQEIQNSRSGSECSSHERQLSVVTYVPPSPYQSKGEEGSHYSEEGGGAAA